ncbi:hypothetical protein K505DRAFT_164805 [Melanomma pulvis-pyrius CBS 109.77]|uniref:Uncharacterized protein n=1 Tax=Melanomma pulvis-pyrius CBS 109.77 TaxID=1314802 RepID=A0A6A6XIQ7_9PLEO|nr:hypothetical protein K505DRAFT_164805 [Melanomma pulvis-pyrius CBS 109.77]
MIDLAADAARPPCIEWGFTFRLVDRALPSLMRSGRRIPRSDLLQQSSPYFSLACFLIASENTLDCQYMTTRAPNIAYYTTDPRHHFTAKGRTWSLESG